MKKTVVVFVALLTLSSCVDQQSSEVIFTLINETDKNIKILAFGTMNYQGEIYDIPKEADEIIIDPNSSYKVTRYTGIDDNVGYAFYSILGVDYVRVIFDNEKVKIYTREAIKNTPDISILNGDKNEQHIITEEDYNTAQDCNGDCEAVK